MRVRPYSAYTQVPRQFSAAAVHLDGTRLHRSGSQVLAKRLQPTSFAAACLNAFSRVAAQGRLRGRPGTPEHRPTAPVTQPRRVRDVSRCGVELDRKSIV